MNVFPMDRLPVRAAIQIQQDHIQVALLALKHSNGSLTFGPREWVPDEYEDLERAGLVRCEFGAFDLFNIRLRSRTIRLTVLGAAVVDNLRVAPIPGRGGFFSYRSAMAHAAHCKPGSHP